MPTLLAWHSYNSAVYFREFLGANLGSLQGLEILKNDSNTDDLIAFMQDRNLPVDDIEALNIAEDILSNPPVQGYLTISNALQWRLQSGKSNFDISEWMLAYLSFTLET
ncbi:MAG: hypothetical protein RID09_06085 [Coleofasciculus sp. G1-WW12-02]